ncbi:MAG: methyltransferase [Chloroflexi bacterium]|nr:methyltransferase [Chloroflexota bacterium]
MNSRDEVLALFSGQRGKRRHCFSGLANVSAPGLEHLGLKFAEVHTDPAKMAAAAATTYRLFGFESAVVPFDLGVEAGALGASVDFHADVPFPIYPTVQPIAAGPQNFRLDPPAAITRHERIATVIEAIRLLKEDVGSEIVVGAWVPGPFTLAMQVVGLLELTTAVATDPDAVGLVLDPLTDVLAEVALAYRAAGADFITVHEMGGSPGFLGPPSFRKIIQPRLQRLLAALPSPRVLSVCGKTNRAMTMLAECGADAISVDQTNDVALSRRTLGPDVMIFGNIDPVGTLANGEESAVREAVRRAIYDGVDAVWPGCDLAPLVPAANMRAMADEARKN